MTRTNEKRNGKLTKRATIRHIYSHALATGKNTHSISYIARRLGFDYQTTIHFMNWMQKHENVKFIQYTEKSFTFGF